MNLLNYLDPINNDNSSNNVKKNKITVAGSSNNYYHLYHQQQQPSSNASLPASYFFGVKSNNSGCSVVTLPSSYSNTSSLQNNYGQYLTSGRFILSSF